MGKHKKKQKSVNEKKDSSSVDHRQDATAHTNNLTTILKHRWPALAAVGISVAIGIYSTKIYYDQESYIGDLNETLQSQTKATEPASPRITDWTDVPCRFVMAESTVPNGGFGVYSTVPIEPRWPVLSGEPVIQLVNITRDQYPGVAHLLHHYAWMGETTAGQHEGAVVYSIIPGLSMLANTRRHSSTLAKSYNVVSNFPKIHHDGLVRGRSPVAGSSTHYHGLAKFAHQYIPAGDEIFVDYGEARKAEINLKFDWDTSRSLDWLAEHGMCLDNIKPGMTKNKGHSAVATRRLATGSVIAPLPVLVIDRQSLNLPLLPGQQQEDVIPRKQLLLNYCYGHEKSSVLLFPYSPVVNLINHYDDLEGDDNNDGENNNSPNAILRWSDRMKDPDSWLALTAEQVKARHESGLLLELVATQDILPGDEIRISYGDAYAQAWKTHVAQYQALSKTEKLGLEPNETKNGYVYAFQANERVSIFRTLKEQEEKPYPSNLETSCFYRYSAEEEAGSAPPKSMNPDMGITVVKRKWNDKIDLSSMQPADLRPCLILERSLNERTETYTYTVQVLNRPFSMDPDERVPPHQRLVVTHVPLAALLFTDVISSTDQHLPYAFRHEIGLPDGVFPPAWMDLE